MNELAYDSRALLQTTIGERGLPEAFPDSEAFARAVDDLRRLAGQADTTFPQLPEQDVAPLLAQAGTDRGRFTDLIVVGIGGSSLGARALLRACAPLQSPRRVHVLENVDPHALDEILSVVDLERTAVNVISKSGGTVETMANFLVLRSILLERFGMDGYRSRVRATTDPQSGSLRQLALDEQLVTLDVPPAVGGRFSVLSAVGLYPLAFAGVDVRALLQGAARARDNALSTSLRTNVAAQLAAHQIALYHRGFPTVVFMPYATRLWETALWFVQLWAESLGKANDRAGERVHVGPTPIPAIGANDQHSQLQLFMEGPADKNVLLLDVSGERHLPVPAIPDALKRGIGHLHGHGLAAIRTAELRGVSAALTAQGRPNAVLSMPDTDPASMGALLMMLQCATGIAGSLLNIDPYDQPGVELAKKYAHGLLGHPEHAELAAQVQLANAPEARTGFSIG